jgi:hypothetical protein
MYSISFFSRFVFDEFIAKGGEYGLALRVLGGVDLVGVLILSFSYSFHGYALFVPFVGLAAFPSCK